VGAEVTARQGDTVAGTARTDATGEFRMDLAPGTYDVTATSPDVTSCDAQRVEVREGLYSPVRIDCRTG
jgi:hypothetical protein